MRDTDLDPTLLRAAVQLTRAVEARLVARLVAQGFAPISTTQLDVFRHLDADGTRVRDLAERIGTTPQATGEMAGILADRGWVRIDTDPQDRRARRVTPTTRATEAVRAAGKELRAIEGGLAQALGRAETLAAKRWMVAAATRLSD